MTTVDVDDMRSIAGKCQLVEARPPGGNQVDVDADDTWWRVPGRGQHQRRVREGRMRGGSRRRRRFTG